MGSIVLREHITAFFFKFGETDKLVEARQKLEKKRKEKAYFNIEETG
jgi:hypothetical protein